jgi:delta 1-pyrroline-5-carboxylate dehydrogenase
MSQVAVERTLGKLVTDATFRRRFFRNPAAASFLAGLELSGVEVDALSRLPVEAIEHFSTYLDDRICRCMLENHEEENR